MKSDVEVKWKFGEQTIKLVVSVPNRQAKLVKKVLASVYKSYITALKAYNYKVIKYSCEE